MSLLRVSNLKHVFAGGAPALRDISLSIEEGEFVVLAGKNGSGKTVFMLHLNGILKPTQGEVLYREKPINERIRVVRQRIGLVFQEPDNQLVGQTVAEDIALGPENLGLHYVEVKKRVEEALLTLGISNLRSRRPFTLSGGEKRKAALAGILAMRPELIVLDEPFSGLDLPGVKSVLESLILLHSAGHTLIVITHDIDKVLAHATRLIVMDSGEIVEDGVPPVIITRVERYGIRGPGKNIKVRDMTWLR
jgi:biotin transport system ATP-binding protein